MKTDGSDQNEKGKSIERSPVQSLKDLLNSDYVKNRFMKVMGEKAPSFLASVLNAIQKNPDLAKCENHSLLSAAMVAATLDLPIDSNLGFAAIVPYNTKIKTKEKKKVNEKGVEKEIEVTVEKWVTLAQFQIMYKGFIQLGLRSGQYKTINVSPIFEDEFESYDIITGDIIIHPVAGGFREQENTDKIIGYAAFFRLINGFERLEYWPISKILAHGKRYSKSFDRPNGLWKTNPHAMYAKTVLKSSISKWGILSVTMQNAIVTDQGSLKDWKKPIDSENVNYLDSRVVMEESDDADQDEDQQPETTANEKTAETTPAKEEAENKETPTVPENTAVKQESPSDTGAQGATKPNGDLFQKDEADALEEQYQRDQAGNDYPDFGG
ncbi:MAG: recombinase RecT [Treponema sp.]|jgi:recombination protein RecT|nr:recombinase RecT [Treponema sp.]